MNYENLLYFDIETVGKYPDLDTLRSNDVRGYDLFMNKIERRKASEHSDWIGDPNDIYTKKAGIMPEFGKTVCVSIATATNGNVKMISAYDHDEEKIMKKVQSIFYKADKTLFQLCGYYIKGFDVPWLNKKMLSYDLEIPKILKTFDVKPWDTPIFDLSEVWKGIGTLESASFDDMLYCLGIRSPKEDMCGKEVHTKYWQNNELERIKTYCEHDVMSCVEAAKKICHLL